MVSGCNITPKSSRNEISTQSEPLLFVRIAPVNKTGSIPGLMDQCRLVQCLSVVDFSPLVQDNSGMYRTMLFIAVPCPINRSDPPVVVTIKTCPHTFLNSPLGEGRESIPPIVTLVQQEVQFVKFSPILPLSIRGRNSCFLAIPPQDLFIHVCFLFWIVYTKWQVLLGTHQSPASGQNWENLSPEGKATGQCPQ